MGGITAAGGRRQQRAEASACTFWQRPQLRGYLHQGTWELPAVFKPHEAVGTVPMDADQPRLRSVNLDGSSSPLSFAVCGCHSYEVSLPLIPPLHGGGAQTHFLPGPRNPSPTAYVEVTLRLRW